MFRGTFIALHAYFRKEEKSKINDLERHIGRMHCDDRSRDGNDIAACQEKSRTNSDHQKLRRVKGGFYPKIQKEATQPTPWFRISNLQNYQPKHDFLTLPGRILQKPDGSKTTKGIDPGITDICKCDCGLYIRLNEDTQRLFDEHVHGYMMLENYRNLLLWGFSLFQAKINSPTGARGRALDESMRSSTRYLCSPRVLVWNKDVRPKAK